MWKDLTESFMLNQTLIFILCGTFLILLFSFVSIRGNWSFKKKPANVTMFGYKMIYTDQKETHKEQNVDYNILLYSSRYDIQGKPDYIFQHIFTGGLVPVEIKSGSIGEAQAPHSGDLLQLAAYFLIIQDIYHRKPRFGYLVYKDYMFQIKNTIKIRKRVKKTLARMRHMLVTGEETANANFATCRYCLCNGTVCEHCKKPKQKKG